MDNDEQRDYKEERYNARLLETGGDLDHGTPCSGCGQLFGFADYDDQLWDLYNRIDDGRSSREGLVFDSEWLQENIIDDEDHASLMHTMERDMANRGLCPKCGRPDLSRVDPSRILSEEDARDMHDMWAEQAAERRAGC